jgi:uncharacterized membrane protein YesL
MLGFLIKKAFFDMWDNLFRVVILNLGFVAVLAIFLLLTPLLAGIPVIAIGTLIIGVALFSVYTGAVSRMASEIADNKSPGFADFWQFVKETFPTSLLLALFITIYVLVVIVAFNFYGSLQNFAGPLAVSLLFWVTTFLVLAGQYFFPVQSRMNRDVRKMLKKGFLLLLDNPGFSIMLFLCTFITLVVSFFIAFIIPGFTALLILSNVALKLRLYKYDYLEKNPDANRRKIPWDTLLVEDREKVGKRTLKGMIFPWKE